MSDARQAPWPGMSLAEWRRHTSHGQDGYQPAWTKDDERRLRERVARMATKRESK